MERFFEDQLWEIIEEVVRFLDVRSGLRWSQSSGIVRPVYELIPYEWEQAERDIRALPTIARAA